MYNADGTRCSGKRVYALLFFAAGAIICGFSSRSGLYCIQVENMETAAVLNDSGIALTVAKRPDEAILLFRKALVMEPENPLLWLNLGIAQQHTGDYEEALSSFQKALDIDETLDEAWLSMGLIHYEQNQFEPAEDCYHTAIHHNNNSLKAWNNLGVLYFTQALYEEARHCFEEAVALAPMYEEALFNLRDVCRELNDFEAAAEFERSLSQFTKRGF